MEIERKLVTVRMVTFVEPIEGADRIECAHVDGWTTVVNKGVFTPNQLGVFFEPDAFLPDGDERWQFLVDKSSNTFNGVKGHKLRTIRLKKVYSNGLLLPVGLFPEIQAKVKELNGAWEDVSFDAVLGIVKYDPPPARNSGGANLAGATKGNFPDFIPKTDSNRAQNLVRSIFDYEPRVSMYTDGDGNPIVATRAPDNTAETLYEVTLKVDGSSSTHYHMNGVVGTCSRNLDLKLDDEDSNNAFVKMFKKLNLDTHLPKFGNIAIQGELFGGGPLGNLNDNNEKIDYHAFAMFNVWFPDEQRYAKPAERYVIFETLREYIRETFPEVDKYFMHAPILHKAVTLKELGITNIAELLLFADGPSFNPQVKREGLVFKRITDDPKDDYNFKAISESWLAKKKS